MASEPVPGLPGIDTKRANVARVYDYWRFFDGFGA